MAYMIQYGNYPQYKSKYKQPNRKHMLVLISAVTIIMIIFFITIPQIKAGLLDLLLPGDAGVTGAAISAFAEDLRTGASFDDAITAFCRYIINNAEIS